MQVATMDSNSARAKWRDLLDTATAGEDVVITRYGKPVTAMINYEDYIALQDELEELREAERVAATYAAWQDDPTRARPYSEIRAELLAEGTIDGDV